jgi:hypothetical protein
MHLRWITLPLLTTLASFAQEITVEEKAPPAVNPGGGGPHWLWIILGIWLVLGGAACLTGLVTESSFTLKHLVLGLLLGPLAFTGALAAHPDKAGLTAGSAVFGIAMVLLASFVGGGPHRDWSDAERILSRVGTGTTVPISDVSAVMGPPDRVTPSERSDGQCYWWDNHGVLVSSGGDVIGNCFYVPKR